MLRLYVMRHAKSSWAVPGARDFDRELNDRGKSDLVKISHAIQSRGLMPSQILCSSAERTRQTLDGILNAITPEPDITYTEKLYSSGLDEYIGLIHSVTSPEPLMIIGHNPMCGTLASILSGKGDPEKIAKIAYKYPTSTISVIDFDVKRWSDVDKGMGQLTDCLIPSEL